MDMSPETLKMLLIIASVVFSNAVTLAVMRSQNNSLTKRVDKHDTDISKLWEDARYNMTGNEIRRILHEQIDPLSTKVDSLHDDVIIMKTRDSAMRTRVGDN